MGIAMIVDSWDAMLFIPALIFSLLVPIGSGVLLGKLGLASRAGSRRAFQASWILAACLIVPVSIAVYVFVLGRWPTSFLAELPQMGVAERIGLASLGTCLILLAAVVVVGFQVRTTLRDD